jgi:hypothetical protein
MVPVSALAAFFTYGNASLDGLMAVQFLSLTVALLLSLPYAMPSFHLF